MSDVTSFLSSIWQLFEDVDVPGLGISFAQLWIGAFVVALSIVILRPLLGIGVGASRFITGVGKRGISRFRNRKRYMEDDS